MHLEERGDGDGGKPTVKITMLYSNACEELDSYTQSSMVLCKKVSFFEEPKKNDFIFKYVLHI